MILAIDTASKTASAAIVEEKRVLAEFSVLSEKTHSKAILPMIESIFKCSGKTPDELEYIACSAGPGSFTGIRIGAAVAKSMAFALNKKIVPVASLDILAYNVLIEDYIICPMLDARRKHVYTSFYRYVGGKLERLAEYMTLPVDDAIARGEKYNLPLYFIGEGAMLSADELREVPKAIIAPPQINIHRAGVLGIYAYEYLGETRAVNGTDFKLLYMSRTQAAGAEDGH